MTKAEKTAALAALRKQIDDVQQQLGPAVPEPEIGEASPEMMKAVGFKFGDDVGGPIDSAQGLVDRFFPKNVDTRIAMGEDAEQGNHDTINQMGQQIASDEPYTALAVPAAMGAGAGIAALTSGSGVAAAAENKLLAQKAAETFGGAPEAVRTLAKVIEQQPGLAAKLLSKGAQAGLPGWLKVFLLGGGAGIGAVPAGRWVMDKLGGAVSPE